MKRAALVLAIVLAAAGLAQAATVHMIFEKPADRPDYMFRPIARMINGTQKELLVQLGRVNSTPIEFMLRTAQERGLEVRILRTGDRDPHQVIIIADRLMTITGIFGPGQDADCERLDVFTTPGLTQAWVHRWLEAEKLSQVDWPRPNP